LTALDYAAGANAARCKCVALLFVSICTLPVLATSHQDPDGSDSLHLLLAEKDDPFTVTASLVNTGPQALVLNLGMMLGNGKGQFPNLIEFQLTTPEGELLNLTPRLGGIAGRIDPMIVPMPSGATYSLRIDFSEFWAPPNRTWTSVLPAGAYTLTAQYTGRGVPFRTANLDMKGVALMPYWTGTVKSNTLRFTIK
jgi:hypothetical protein